MSEINKEGGVGTKDQTLDRRRLMKMGASGLAVTAILSAGGVMAQQAQQGQRPPRWTCAR